VFKSSKAEVKSKQNEATFVIDAFRREQSTAIFTAEKRKRTAVQILTRRVERRSCSAKATP
jgi:transposase